VEGLAFSAVAIFSSTVTTAGKPVRLILIAVAIRLSVALNAIVRDNRDLESDTA
jgi:hypothetical protein